MNQSSHIFRTCLFLLSLLPATAFTRPVPAGLFTDHAVLQRDKPIPVWGQASPGEKVTVSFGGGSRSVKADAEGHWKVLLDPLSVTAEPRQMVISGDEGEPVVLNDILVGDVWLCSGQSNMGVSVRSSLNAEQEMANAQYPGIRLFSVTEHPSVAPVNDVKGRWVLCSPQTVAGFSGAAYFFGRQLYRELQIPIGLLHSSVGATPVEGWTRLAALETIPTLGTLAHQELARLKSQADDNAKFPAARLAWEREYKVERPEIAGVAQRWADPALDTGDWKSVTLNRAWEQLGFETGGVFWVRKDAVLPELVAGKPFLLKLNSLAEQYDTTYFNGVEVGRTSDQAPEFYNIQRKYQVPGKLVHAGTNVIAVRIVSPSQKNGFWGSSSKELELPGVDPATVDDFWLLKQESAFPALTDTALASRPKPNNIDARNVPSSLYNGMIAPLVPFAIKGVIWYQGESNVGHADRYRELLSLMIRDWRAQWGQGEFPFILQQLVNFGSPPKQADEHGAWPYLREAQMQVADSLSNCDIAVGIEIGEAHNLHPKNKQDVGKRLALVALEKVYGRKIESSGPRFDSMKIEGATIRVKFSHAEGLVSKGGVPKNFVVSGADKKFFWADAKIEGETVVVSNPQVAQPAAVRYAWADSPADCNLYNAAGLPAAPFRTDTTEK